MFHWGKLLGTCLGFFVAEIPGALFGFVLGFLADACFIALQKPKFSQLQPGQISDFQKEFFVATFTVMGYIAANSQSPSNDRMMAAERVVERLRLAAEVREEAIRLFQLGMSPKFNLNDVLLPFFTRCRLQENLLQMFMELQIYAALVDGKLGETERTILIDISKALEISRSEFDRLLGIIRTEQHYRRNPEAARPAQNAEKQPVLHNPRESSNISDAYAILNIPQSASNDEIKKAYRRMRSMHHPDKLLARGLPEEMLRIAEDKTREIRTAYERIRAVRHF